MPFFIHSAVITLPQLQSFPCFNAKRQVSGSLFMALLLTCPATRSESPLGTSVSPSIEQDNTSFFEQKMIMKSSEIFGEEVLENSRSHRRQALEKDSRPSCNQLPHSKKTAREEETTMMGFFQNYWNILYKKKQGTPGFWCTHQEVRPKIKPTSFDSANTEFYLIL